LPDIFQTKNRMHVILVQNVKDAIRRYYRALTVVSLFKSMLMANWGESCNTIKQPLISVIFPLHELLAPLSIAMCFIQMNIIRS